MSKKLFQKLTTLIIIGTLCMPYIVSAQAHTAADSTAAFSLPTHDESNSAANTEHSVTQKIDLAQQILKITKDYGLDQVAYTLAQAIGQKLANKVINKAKGGASGDSSQDSYIKNYGDFFANVAAQDLDKFASKLEISNNPFAQEISRSLIRDSATILRSTGATDDPLSGFNLDRIIGANWKDFSNDASVGGWDGILALTNPSNTNIGSAMVAQQKFDEQLERSRADEIIKLTSPGIKPQGKCSMDISQYKRQIDAIKYAKTNINDNKDQIKNIQSANANKTFTDADINRLQAETGKTFTSLEDIEKAVNKSSGVNSLKSENLQSGAQIAANVKGMIEDYGGCISELISNPVNLVSTGLEGATQYALKQTHEIKGWGQVVAGTFISLFSSFIQTGLSSLSADFQAARNRVGGPEQLVAKNGQQINWTQSPTVVVDLQASLEQSQKDTAQEIKLLQGYVDAVTDDGDRSFLTGIVGLDTCIPGPDFGYENRLNAYFAGQISKTQRKLSKGNDTAKETKEDTLDNVDASILVAESEMSLWSFDPTRNIPGATIMLQQINRLPDIRAKYREKRDTLLARQQALALTYDVEAKLKGNIQILRQFIPTLPNQVAFTTREWDKMSAADKTILFNWAKSISTGIQPPANPTPETQKIFSMAVVWDVWTNPENYITYKDGWNAVDPATQTSKATDFLQGSQYLTDRGLMGKNEIRALYSSMMDRLSISRTVEQANLDLVDIQSTITNLQNLTADCMIMKGIIQNNRPSSVVSPSAHQNTIAALQARKAEFKTDAIRDSLSLPSILTEPYNRFPMNMSNCDSGTCRQNVELLIQDGEVPDYEREYQVTPARSVWELIEQPYALCGLNDYLENYKQYLSRPTLDGGKPIECSSEWYGNIVESKKDILRYFYGNNLY